MPRVLRDIVVHAVADEPDLEIVEGQGGTLGQTVASSLLDLGHEPGNIRTERFGPTGG